MLNLGFANNKLRWAKLELVSNQFQSDTNITAAEYDDAEYVRVPD